MEKQDQPAEQQDQKVATVEEPQITAASTPNQEEEVEETKVEENKPPQESLEDQDPEPTGPFLYGNALTEALSEVLAASRGQDDALQSTGLTQEEAKTTMAMFKEASKKVEAFRTATSPDEASFVQLLNSEYAEVKKYLTYSLHKLCKRAMSEIDMPLLQVLVPECEIDFNQGQFKSLVTNLIVQEGWKEQQRLEEDVEQRGGPDLVFPGPCALQYIDVIEYMFDDSRYGEKFLRFVDRSAYGNNLLHVCVELHNFDFMKVILTKCATYGADLHLQKNFAGCTPDESLTKEFEKAENGINPARKERQLALLARIKDLLAQHVADIAVVGNGSSDPK